MQVYDQNVSYVSVRAALIYEEWKIVARPRTNQQVLSYVDVFCFPSVEKDVLVNADNARVDVMRA